MGSKDIESLLRERLSAGSSRPLPSPDFEERVRLSLKPRPGNQWRKRTATGLLAIAAALAVVAVGLPWMLAPRPGVVGDGETARASAMNEPASASPSEQASVPTAATLSRGRIWNFEFNYPAAWALRDGDTANTNGEPVYNALGTLGPVSEACQRPYGQLTVNGTEMSECAATWSLVAGSAAMTFEWRFNPNPGPWSLLAAESGPPAGTQLVTVAAVRAIYARNLSNRVPISSTVAGDATIPGADEVLTWELVDRFNGFNGFKITAAIRGPNTADLEAQVHAVIASMHYLPAIVPLETDETSKAAALEEFFRTVPTGRLGCYPPAGATGTATVTHVDVVQLSKPLAVRCTVQIEPEPEQVWQVTLTWEWDAASDHAAGKAVEIWHNTPTWDGAAIDMIGFESIPYAMPNTGNG